MKTRTMILLAIFVIIVYEIHLTISLEMFVFLIICWLVCLLVYYGVEHACEKVPKVYHSDYGGQRKNGMSCFSFSIRWVPANEHKLSVLVVRPLYTDPSQLPENKNFKVPYIMALT